MRSTAMRALQAYLWFIAAFHLVVGLGVSLSPGFAQAVARGYGATVDWTPQFIAILRPLGAFMIILGVIATFAARDPVRYAGVVYGFIALFALRALQRIVFAGYLTQAFGIAAGRNMVNVVIFAGQAALLFALWNVATRRPAAAPAPA
jgi:hypothetical protein